MEDKECKNCCSFMQHYVKTSLGIIKTPCGHCINEKSPYYFKKSEKACKQWKENISTEK